MPMNDRHQIAPAAGGVERGSALVVCPRCGDRLHGVEEPECLACGYVDYSRVDDALGSYRVSAFGGGDQQRIRYMGPMPDAWGDTTILLTLSTNPRGAVLGWQLDCPFCGESMLTATLTGKRRTLRQRVYVCPEDHRVHIGPTDAGELGWR